MQRPWIDVSRPSCACSRVSNKDQTIEIPKKKERGERRKVTEDVELFVLRPKEIGCRVFASDGLSVCSTDSFLCFWALRFVLRVSRDQIKSNQNESCLIVSTMKEGEEEREEEEE